MRKILLTGLMAMAAAGTAHAAPPPTIVFTPGVYTVPAFTSATVFEEFNGGVAGTNYTGAQATGGRPESTTGTVRTLQGNVPGDGFSPDPDNNNYIAIQANSSFTIGLTGGVTVFSFVLGTLDSYNSLQLFFSDNTSQIFTGQQIIGGPAPVTNPVTTGETGRVTYDTGGASLITSAVFRSNGFDAFEIDGIASAVPEPGTWALMILGFGLIGSQLRMRRRKGNLALA